MKSRVIVFTLAVLVTQARAANLRGMAIFDATSSGGYIYALWDTNGTNIIWNVYLNSNGTNSTTWINSDTGNTVNDSHEPLNFDLSGGLTTLWFYAENVSTSRYLGIDLFFDTSNIGDSPSITAVLDKTEGTLFANTSPQVPGLQGFALVSNTSNATSFTKSGVTIALTSVSEATGFDTVQAFSNSPGGYATDVAGELTLDVTAPEPASLGLLLGGLAALGLLRRTTNQNKENENAK